MAKTSEISAGKMPINGNKIGKTAENVVEKIMKIWTEIGVNSLEY